MPVIDEEHDALEILEFFLRLADQDADLVGTFLLAAGFERGTSFPQDALLRLTAYCRLRHWESIGIAADDARDLPSSDQVFADVVAQLSGEPTRFETSSLCQQVQMYALRRLTWPQTGGATFVLQDCCQPADLLDSIADLLWKFRDLADLAALNDRTGKSCSEQAE
jgi:hypothetical protein